MFVAVASGKGGTGKTTVATSLALAVAKKGKVQFLDCDVEEPNGHLFMKPTWVRKKPVTVLVPQVDLAKCTFCGRCAEVCAFHALVVLPADVLIFPGLCHSCGGCWHLCPEGAITPVPQEIGWLEEGKAGEINFVHGRLKVGVAISPPLIQAVKDCRSPEAAVIADVPPGTSCLVIKAVEGADFCLLVTEPTPFGLHDLKLAAGMIRELNVPGGVVINRSNGKDEDVERFCRREGLPLLLKLPLEREIAVGYARGLPLLAIRPQWEEDFLALWAACEKMRLKEGPGKGW